MLDKSLCEATVTDLYLARIWKITCWGWKVFCSSEKPPIVPSYLSNFSSFSFAHSNNIKPNTVTSIGVIISVWSLRKEDKSISKDLLQDCNTFRKFCLVYKFSFTRTALLGPYAMWLSSTQSLELPSVPSPFTHFLAPLSSQRPGMFQPPAELEARPF